MSGLPDPRRKLTLAQVISNALAAERLDLHTCCEGVIHAYDPASQTADVQPEVMQYQPNPDADPTPVLLPICTGVPVLFLGSSTTGFRETFPLVPGDTGTLFFSESSLDTWIQNGGQVDPKDIRRQSLSDGLFLPGLKPNSKPWTNVTQDTASWGFDTGPQLVARQGSPALEIGGNAANPPTDYAALASLVIANLNAFKTTVNNWIPVPNDGGAALKTALQALFTSGWPTAVAASALKVK